MKRVRRRNFSIPRWIYEIALFLGLFVAAYGLGYYQAQQNLIAFIEAHGGAIDTAQGILIAGVTPGEISWQETAPAILFIGGAALVLIGIFGSMERRIK